MESLTLAFKVTSLASFSILFLCLILYPGRGSHQIMVVRNCLKWVWGVLFCYAVISESGILCFNLFHLPPDSSDILWCLGVVSVGLVGAVIIFIPLMSLVSDFAVSKGIYPNFKDTEKRMSKIIGFVLLVDYFLMLALLLYLHVL